jgi:hypothetical protein
MLVNLEGYKLVGTATFANRNNNVRKLRFIWMLFSAALDANNPDTDRRIKRRAKEHGVA